MVTFKRILVTGSSGVLGSAFKALRDEFPWYEMFFATDKDCDLTDLYASLDYVKGIGPDAIVHLAAVSGGVILSMEHPATVLRDNILMSIHVLEISRILEIKKLVMTLYSGMFPADAPIPIKEEYIHQGPAHPSNCAYAYAKRLIEPAIRGYRAEYGVSVIGVIPNGIFGPNDKFDAKSATFITALIKRFYENKNNDSPIVVWGDGSPLREITYSADMARAFMWCLSHYDSEQVLNVGTSEEHSIKDIAFMIAEELGIDTRRIVFDTSKPSGIFRKSTDNSKFVQLSGFRYAPLRVGIKNTIEWLKRNNHLLKAGSPKKGE